LVKDFSSAVQSLEEACKLFDSKYGISADECADAYMAYGSALLELHRQESGVLDGLVDSKAQEDEEEEDDEEIEDEELKDEQQDKSTVETENGKATEEEDISKSPTPAEATNGTSTVVDEQQQPAASNSSTTTNGNSSTVAEAGSISDQDKQSMETDDVDPNQPSTSTGITDENRVEDEEDSTPSNIEVAFEVLTMAKQIFQRQTEYQENVFLKLSDALQKLGEILYEWENNEESLKELNECLEIRKRHLPDDDRLIAEAYYHIGLAHMFNQKIAESNVQFQKAVDVIEARLNKLKSSYTNEPEGSENRAKIENEIKDLESVLPEMKARIEENQDEMSTSKLASVVEADEKAEEEAFAKKKEQISAKPISNLTHLVKRKREAEPTEQENKKLKNGNENGSNGTANNVEMKED